MNVTQLYETNAAITRTLGNGDACFDPGFEPEVDGRALDAYRHLFAYAAAEQTGNTNVRRDTLAA